VILNRQALLAAALSDQLTGLGNRHRLELEQELLSIDRRAAWWIAIDLDGFKRAQDAPGRGHGWGDALLVAFAGWLRDSTRASDALVFRPGGDEFLVRVLSEKASRAVARRVGSWSRDGVTATVGIGTSIEEADSALSRAKRGRRMRRS
jgi:diguanylate cyclase (GGDEF)-like protein